MRAQLINANLIGDNEMGKHTGRMIPKTGKRRSGKTDKGGPIAKRKVVRQKATTMLGTGRPGVKKKNILKSFQDRSARPKRKDNVPAQRIKKPINLKNVRRAMNKGGFPDLSGDGKVTQKDILMGRGVIKKAGGGSAMPGMKKRVMANKGKRITKKRVKKKMKRTMKRGGGMAMAKRPMRRGGGMMKKNMM